MIIEGQISQSYNITCEKCGQIIQKHKAYCKQYGDEYWFNPPLVCPSCGNSDKIARLGKDYREINDEKSLPDNSNSKPIVKPMTTQSNPQINNSYPVSGYTNHSNTNEEKKQEVNSSINQSITSAIEKSKMNFVDKLKYAKNITQHVEENEKLKEKIRVADETIVKLTLENSRLKTEINAKDSEKSELQAMLTDEHHEALNIKDYLVELHKRENEVIQGIQDKTNEVLLIENKIVELTNQVIELDDEVLYQSFGLYKPIYDFTNSSLYKEQLDEVRRQQKERIKNKTAVCSYTSWTVNGSKAQGNKMTNDNIKQILRCFNAECENVIDRVKFNNYDSMKSRITKSFEALNKLNDVNMIYIEDSYLELKYEELNLAYEYQLKKQEEKEELRILREQQREDAKVAKEIEEKRREIEKEQQHYENALSRLNDQIQVEKNESRLEFLLEKKKEIAANLVDLDIALKEVDYREANQRAGYVYIISNIGAFGEDVFKIGMTRRLDPQERVDELGNASVPFKYDIHAMIFSDDAPKLENALHRAFDNKRINAINTRKEFFRVSLADIEKVVNENHDKSVEFVKASPAQQYRETSRLMSNSNMLNRNL
jgi:hypothetical protein